MAGSLIEIITSADPADPEPFARLRLSPASREQLVAACAELDAFRRRSDNLYERVRALVFSLRHPPVLPAA